MPVSEESADKKVWELVKQIEHVCDERTDELKEAVATMDVNFGEDGRKAKGVVNTSQRVAPMIVSALKWYEAENARLKHALEALLENYKHNNGKGLGIGPVQQARAVLNGKETG